MKTDDIAPGDDCPACGQDGGIVDADVPGRLSRADVKCDSCGSRWTISGWRILDGTQLQ